MPGSADTCTSAVSSGADCSSPASSAGSSRPPASQAEPALRVDFYILEESSVTARLRLACKLAEKAYLTSQVALVWSRDAEELKAFDEMLWTFMDGSFVPHDILLADSTAAEAPVLLSLGCVPAARVDVIINLAPQVPDCLALTRRVAEIVDGDEGRRRAGRVRFKAYRELGVEPASHHIRSE